MIGGIIQAVLGLSTEIFRKANTDSARKYLDRAVELQLKINEEEGKGYDADDSKLEKLYDELHVIMDAAKAEVALFAARAAGK